MESFPVDEWWDNRQLKATAPLKRIHRSFTEVYFELKKIYIFWGMCDLNASWCQSCMFIAGGFAKKILVAAFRQPGWGDLPPMEIWSLPYCISGNIFIHLNVIVGLFSQWPVCSVTDKQLACLHDLLKQKICPQAGISVLCLLWVVMPDLRASLTLIDATLSGRAVGIVVHTDAGTSVSFTLVKWFTSRAPEGFQYFFVKCQCKARSTSHRI